MKKALVLLISALVVFALADFCFAGDFKKGGAIQGYASPWEVGNGFGPDRTVRWLVGVQNRGERPLRFRWHIQHWADFAGTDPQEVFVPAQGSTMLRVAPYCAIYEDFTALCNSLGLSGRVVKPNVVWQGDVDVTPIMLTEFDVFDSVTGNVVDITVKECFDDSVR